MSSEEISLNGLNSQLVFHDDPLRFSCHQQQQQQHQHQHHHHHHQHHRVGDPGPKTRELAGFIDDKMFSVDRERYFRPQPSEFRPNMFTEPRDPHLTRRWNGDVTSASSDESNGDDDDADVDDDNNSNRNCMNNLNRNGTNCNNNNETSNNCSHSIILAAAAEKIGNGNKHPSFGKNGNVVQTVNNTAVVTVAEADGDVYYSQYLQGTEGSSGSGQKEGATMDGIGFGISGSGESLRAILSDPITGALMDDAMILPCGHSFGAAGVQQVIRAKACYTCSRSVSEDSITPNLSLRAAVRAFRQEDELQFYRSPKRRRERPDHDKGSYGDSTHTDHPRTRGVQFPFAVTDRVIIKGNKRTPQRFVGREAVVTTQCLNGWYVVKTLDNAESVKLQYRSLAKVSDDPSAKPLSSKIAPNWL